MNNNKITYNRRIGFIIIFIFFFSFIFAPGKHSVWYFIYF